MKRIVALLVMICAFVAMSAQSTLLTKSQVTVSDPAWIHNWSLATVDSLGAVQDSIIYPMFINTADSIRAHVKIKITEVTSACNITVKFRGKNYSGDTPTDLATVRYYGVGTDTTFIMHGANYNYYDVLFIRNANKARVSTLSFYYKKKN